MNTQRPHLPIQRYQEALQEGHVARSEGRLATDAARPLNPMVNAGTIATCSLVAGSSADDRLQRPLATLSP